MKTKAEAKKTHFFSYPQHEQITLQLTITATALAVCFRRSKKDTLFQAERTEHSPNDAEEQQPWRDWFNAFQRVQQEFQGFQWLQVPSLTTNIPSKE